VTFDFSKMPPRRAYPQEAFAAASGGATPPAGGVPMNFNNNQPIDNAALANGTANQPFNAAAPVGFVPTPVASTSRANSTSAMTPATNPLAVTTQQTFQPGTLVQATNANQQFQPPLTSSGSTMMPPPSNVSTSNFSPFQPQTLPASGRPPPTGPPLAGAAAAGLASLPTQSAPPVAAPAPTSPQSDGQQHLPPSHTAGGHRYYPVDPESQEAVPVQSMSGVPTSSAGAPNADGGARTLSVGSYGGSAQTGAQSSGTAQTMPALAADAKSEPGSESQCPASFMRMTYNVRLPC
jgi:hypothetical protein